MEQSPLRLVKRYAEYLGLNEIDDLPLGLRGIYVLYKYRPRAGRYDVVYVGMAAAGRRGGIRGRLRGHRRKKKGLWTHCSVYEVWDNVRDDEVTELEGLFRHIYRRDSAANRLNVQKGFKKLRMVHNQDVETWKHRDAF